MIHSNTTIIKHKVGLLNLAEELGNVSKACRVMGLSRDTFYRYKEAVEEGGVEALLDRNRSLKLKRVLAEQFEQLGPMLAGFGGPNGSALIDGRNQVAIDVLGEQIAGGKKKLGIFYGAGHLADMEVRLREQFQLEPVQVHWLTAWDLRAD